MTKKPRENRVPIMMSEDELTAIDDWRFANKVATRSDAVRRLCRIGLLADEQLEGVLDDSLHLHEGMDILRRMTEIYVSSMVRRTGDAGPLDMNDYANYMSEVADDVTTQVVALWNSIVPMSDYKTIEQAKARSDANAEEIREAFGDIIERKAKRRSETRDKTK